MIALNFGVMLGLAMMLGLALMLGLVVVRALTSGHSSHELTREEREHLAQTLEVLSRMEQRIANLETIVTALDTTGTRTPHQEASQADGDGNGLRSYLTGGHA